MFKSAFCVVGIFVGFSVSVEAKGACGSIVVARGCNSGNATGFAVTDVREKPACTAIEPRMFSTRPVNFCRIDDMMAEATATPLAAPAEASNPFGDVFAFPMVMACMADDKATFANLRFAIGSNAVPDRWPSGYSLEVCEHKLLRRL